MNKIRQIGDIAWHAESGTRQETEVCPECCGKKYLTVILGDDSQVTIDCAGCASGYDPSKGYVSYWAHSAKVRQVMISGMEIPFCSFLIVSFVLYGRVTY